MELYRSWGTLQLDKFLTKRSCQEENLGFHRFMSTGATEREIMLLVSLMSGKIMNVVLNGSPSNS